MDPEVGGMGKFLPKIAHKKTSKNQQNFDLLGLTPCGTCITL
jgi:hypothetical protein